MSWAALDYDDENADRYGGFWNLSHKTTMYDDASDLAPYRLLPIEKSLRKPVEADWTFNSISRKKRIVAFRERTHGGITLRKWEFGDGRTSGGRNPIYRHKKAGEYIVTLNVEDPQKARRAGRESGT